MTITKNEIDKTIKHITKHTAKTITEHLVKNSSDPINPEEVRENVLSLLSLEYEEERLISAFESVVDYLDRFSTPVELNEIKKNWIDAFNAFFEVLKEKKEVTKEVQFTPLQDLLGITSKTYQQFYAAGRDLFIHHQYKKASDVFFLLAILNNCYYSVWLSLGLCEERCSNFESALVAYTMAMITDNDSPEPFLCAANCCIEMSDKHEAEVYLDEAMERIDHDPKKYVAFKAEVTKIKHLIK